MTTMGSGTIGVSENSLGRKTDVALKITVDATIS